MLPGGFEVAVELARIGSGPGSIEQRSAAMLDQLRRVIPFQAAWIGLHDPERGNHTSLAGRGYDDTVRARLASPAVTEEIELLGVHRARVPMRLRDLSLPPTESTTWARYLWPAGFREGLVVGLFTQDGRYLGMLGLNTESAAHPTDAARDLVGMLAPAIAYAVDPLRSMTAAARLVHGATGATVLTRAGDALPLPGLPAHPLLAAGSDVLAVAAGQLTGADAYTAFLCPYAEPVAPAGHVQITVLACPTQPPAYLVAVVVVAPPRDLYALTGRELEILGLLVEGWPNRRIATTLFIAERTVATHVEHILAKLDAPSRTLAAIRAQRQGLYVPRALHPAPSGAGHRRVPAPTRPDAVTNGGVPRARPVLE